MAEFMEADVQVIEKTVWGSSMLSVQLIHMPTGLTVTCAGGMSKPTRKRALRELRAMWETAQEANKRRVYIPTATLHYMREVHGMLYTELSQINKDADYRPTEDRITEIQSGALRLSNELVELLRNG